jgi:hypothetical protein
MRRFRSHFDTLKGGPPGGGPPFGSYSVNPVRPAPLSCIMRTRMMSANPDMAVRFGPLQDRLKTIGPLLDNYRVHFPI